MKRLLLLFMLFIPISMGFSQLPNNAVTTESHDQCEMAIAVSPTNSNYLVAGWNDNRENRVPGDTVRPGFGYSTDGGNTWINYALHPLISSTNYYSCCDPSVSFDNQGNVYYVFFARPHYPISSDWDSMGAVIMAKSTFPPRDRNYWSYQFVHNSTQDDKPYMVIDNDTGSQGNGNIYVTWTRFEDPTLTPNRIGGTEILVSLSTDHGVNWTDPYSLADAGGDVSGTLAILSDLGSGSILPTPIYNYVQSAMPAVGPNGDVYVAWCDNHPPTDPEGTPPYNASIIWLKKLPYGGSWSEAIKVANCTFINNVYGVLRYANLPAIAVGPTDYVYVTFIDVTDDTHPNSKVVFYKSSDPINVPFTPTSLILDDIMVQPSVTVDPTGFITL
ncbi:MAG: sialidase family protein [Bacteroidota bacterium]